MHPKHLASTFIIVCLVALAWWWLRDAATPAQVKPAPAQARTLPQPAPAEDEAIVPLPEPKPAPVSAAPDFQADLTTALPDMIRRLRSDPVGFLLVYMEPDDLAKMTPDDFAKYANLVTTDPATKARNEYWAAVFEAQQTQIPVPRADNPDEVTFDNKLPTPNLEDGFTVGGFLMRKINGRWYLTTWDVDFLHPFEPSESKSSP